MNSLVSKISESNEEFVFEEEISAENATESDVSDTEEVNLDENYFIPPEDHPSFDFREETAETFRNRTRNDQERVKYDFIKIQSCRLIKSLFLYSRRF